VFISGRSSASVDPSVKSAEKRKGGDSDRARLLKEGMAGSHSKSGGSGKEGDARLSNGGKAEQSLVSARKKELNLRGTVHRGELHFLI